MKDLLIIGSGPAAMSAAIYASRAKLSTIVYERDVVGGRAAIIDQIENYPAFTGTGAELMSAMKAQAVTHGAIIEYGECESLARDPQTGHIRLTIDGETTTAKSVIIASGSEPRKLGIPGEDSAGIHYCATCDGALYPGKSLVVIGGGNSAVQEALFLLKFATDVTIVSRSPLRATDELIDKLKNEPRIHVLIGSTPTEFLSDESHHFTALRVQKTSTKTGTPKITDLKADGCFVFIGYTPATKFLAGSDVKLSADEYIIADRDGRTSVPGVFAAGDVVDNVRRQVVTAVAAGAIAAMSASEYLHDMLK
jgi:thioredoxin reductase (NADPH)